MMERRSNTSYSRRRTREAFARGKLQPAKASSVVAPRKLPKNVLFVSILFFIVYTVTPPRISTTTPYMCGFPIAMGFPIKPSNSVGRNNIDREGSSRYDKNTFRHSQKSRHLMVLGGPPMEDINDPRFKLRKNLDFRTALAIVPPIEDWDRLQRARHFARDPVFREWPPAIRLFHPFDKSPNIAFDIAQLIEDLEIEPFDVTLDSWVIIPNVEATKMEWENQQFLPDVVEGGTLDSYYDDLNQQTENEVRKLIESEERKGKIKALKKNADYGKKPEPKETGEEDEQSRPTPRRKKSPAQLREEQRKSIEEDFGGPCILCLEPNEESKERLMEVRELLLESLDLDSYSSPSSLYSWEFVDLVDMGYRPLIPISKFDTFKAGMEKARRLKGLWGDPLTINVKCVEILSCKSPDDSGVFSEEEEEDGEDWESFHMRTSNRYMQQATAVEMKKEAWGCNAKIMLLGEEVQQDNTLNEKMMEQLLESGEIGGADISMDFTILDDEEESTTDLERWLDEDDDFDEGTQVVIGRTHFFTGDQRNYKGMPATSVVDAKDRSLGEAGAVSGLARRRGSTSRKQNVWADGEYGRRSKDFLPWGARERKEKEKYTWEEEDLL